MGKLIRAIIIGAVLIVVLPFLPKGSGKIEYSAEPRSDPAEPRRSVESANIAQPQQAAPTVPSSGVIESAYRNQTSNFLVRENGTLDRILSDDNDGSRHQRFIVRLSTGHTVLVSHNIDLAPRIPNPHVGDAISFQGEYEWSSEGGVIHWTHHNPRGGYPAGYLYHAGIWYQ